MAPITIASVAQEPPDLPQQITNFYKQFVKNLPLGMAILHLKDPAEPRTWKLIAQNALPARLVGRTVQHFIALPIVQVPPSVGPSDATGLYRQVVVQNRPKPLGHIHEHSRLHPNEMFALKACPLPNNCVAILVEDISPITRARRDQMKAESRLNQMCESARAILWIADPFTLEFRYVTPEAHLILGYWMERWYKEPSFWRKHTHPDDWELVRTNCSLVAADGRKRHFDCRMFDLRGRICWFGIHVHLLNPPGGRSELSGVMVDITDQKRNEQDARELSLQVMRAQEQERKRISRELHDSIGQFLTSLHWSLAGIGRNSNGDGELKRKAEECVRLVQTCMEEVRSVSYALRPPLLDMFGLIPALRWHAKSFSEQTALQIKLELPREMRRLGPDAELTLFRVFQECLSNVRRHAKTDSASVRLRSDSRIVVLEVQDCGAGVPPDLLENLERGGQGIGLLKMRERVNELRGKLEIHSNGKGTLVRAQIPLDGAPGSSLAVAQVKS